MFQINNVTRKYGEEFALKNVSMTIGKGLTFIVGSSGSGKTTLLKLISGMENQFEGEISYCGKKMKELSEKEKSSFYNQHFGFVWQEFNLIEDATVMENVLLPTYLKAKTDRKKAEQILRDFNIWDLANQKVKKLSGGQKQRTAIARELMKNPQVIIADEPTSALDDKTAKATMTILRELAKHRTVIVVTHDMSFITEKDTVFELDKGELVSSSDTVQKNLKAPPLNRMLSSGLSLKNAFSLAKTNLKNKISRFFVAVFTLMIAGVLLLTSVNGAVGQKSNAEFDSLLQTYGDSLLNMTIAARSMGAGGGGGSNSNVTQDFDGLYEKYAQDKRVEFVAYVKNFRGIKVTADSKTYDIEASGIASKINKLLAGKIGDNSKNEVVVPEGLVKQMGLTNEEAIGKQISFKSSTMNWDTGGPVANEINIPVTISGVADASVVYEQDNGNPPKKYVLDDAFFFSKAALEEIRKQAGIQDERLDFIMRAKTPADLISLKNELNQQGIAPLGRFELVEDLVRMNAQTSTQSSSASSVIAGLSVLMVAAVFLLTGFMRKRDYAIYKVSGFHHAQLHLLHVAETFYFALSAILLMLVTSPLLNKATVGLFGVDILNGKMLLTGTGLLMGMAVIGFLMTMITYLRTKTADALKAGGRA